MVAERLWRDSGLKPQDIQTAFIYDHFTPFVFTQLEELGFCGRGEAKDFATVERLSLGGDFPINTNGGLLGEAYIHGMNGITEECARCAARRITRSTTSSTFWSPPEPACPPAG